MVWVLAAFVPHRLASARNTASHSLCRRFSRKRVIRLPAHLSASRHRTDLTGNVFMLRSPSGLRSNENACVLGAQTERRGEATRPVRDLLTGESSPAGSFARGKPCG